MLKGGDAAWAKAEAISWGPEKYTTAFRAQWDDAGLYLRWDATDPDPWFTMTKRDEHLWGATLHQIAYGWADLDAWLSAEDAR